VKRGKKKEKKEMGKDRVKMKELNV